MEEPVIAQDGYTYEKAAILKWFATGKRTSPKTGVRLLSTELVPNYSMRSLIKDLKAQIPVLARHQLDMSSIEAAIKLREEEIEQNLALKGNLLAQEKDKVSKLESELAAIGQRTASLPLSSDRNNLSGSTTRISSNSNSELSNLNQDVRSLIVKIAESEAPFWDVISLEGGLQEKSSRLALINLAQVLLGELNSQLGVNQAHLVAAIKEASSQNIIDRKTRIVYTRINEAAEDAKGKESNVSGKPEIGSGFVSVKPTSSPGVVVKNWSKEEIDQLSSQARENDLQALNQLLLLAQGNNSYAQNNLGWMYQNGEGVSKDYKKAVEWLKKAAEQGNAKAQYSLGVMYAKGDGVSKSYKKAAYWFKKAADQGDADAQYILGLMHKIGKGVSKNDKKAVEWYQKAADQGYANAQNNLGVMYANGYGVSKDAQKAVYWYQKAADQGNADAQQALERLKGRL